ncbi:recombinase family protein [Leucobacter sp. wl10]|uniref:recombinase family protein n=1 Tax=Leucobacter sp. wl10 TaxID=2304677 RepID=UPI002110B258|nr:recombinase family protein [Leucobacter sp. wl10]
MVAWHVDRLYRRPRELEDLIDLVESHPIRIEAVMGGAFDLNTHEDRLMARQLVAMAAYESGHKADRIRRANRQKAERGDWHGAAKFGYGTGGVLIAEQAAVSRPQSLDVLSAVNGVHVVSRGEAERIPISVDLRSTRIAAILYTRRMGLATPGFHTAPASPVVLLDDRGRFYRSRSSPRW